MRWEEFSSGIRYLRIEEQQRVREAFELAESLHRGQTRSSGEPYFNHCVMVATLLANHGADGDTLCAALLHDTLEDTRITLAEVHARFGREVQRLIEGVTKLTREELLPLPTLDKRVETLRKIFTLMQSDVRIMVIKLCDRLHNMQTIAALPPEKQHRIAQETLDVYAKIADRFCMQDIRDELEGLSIAIVDPELHAALTSLRTTLEEEQRGALDEFRSIFQTHHDLLPQVQISTEANSWSRLRRHLTVGGKAASGSPTITLVLTVETEEECYRVLYVLHHHWQREIGSFQDFIHSARTNGYRGLHTTVITQSGTRIRCEIRTRSMHAYARRGIATACFRTRHGETPPEGKLAWTAFLPLLSAESREKSEEFWESLQSDILGESISIHAPDGRLLLIPKGSTALDGALHCFGEETLHLLTISMNGQEVPLHTPLEETASIEGTFARRPTVERRWLEWSRTSLARALIRQGLSRLPLDQKLAVGKQLLQEAFTREHRGLIEEFDLATLRDRLSTIGLRDLPDTFIAIAEGKREPEEITEALFAEQRKDPAMVEWILLTFTTDIHNTNAVRYLVNVYEQYNLNLSNIRFWCPPGSSTRRWRAGMCLPRDAQLALAKEVRLAGARDVRVIPRWWWWRTVLGVVAVFLLWGMDPVVAHLLIQSHDLSAIDMTIVRFWSLTVISTLFLLWVRAHQTLVQTRLQLRNTSLWISVVLLLGVSLATYTSLQTTLPSHYSIPMTSAGLLTTTLINWDRWRLLSIAWFLVLTSVVILFASTPSWPISGIVATFLAITTFTAFSLVSERYKQQERIDARAGQYFFVLSLLCALATLFLLPLATLDSLSSAVLAQLILFSVFFAGLPYYLYYYLLSHREIDFVLRFSFLVVPVTIAGQALFHSTPTPPIIIASLLVISGALLPLTYHRKGSQGV